MRLNGKEAVAVAATHEAPPIQPALYVDDGPQVGIFTSFHRWTWGTEGPSDQPRVRVARLMSG